MNRISRSVVLAALAISLAVGASWAAPTEAPPSYLREWRTEQDRDPRDLCVVYPDHLAIVDQSVGGVIVTTSGSFIGGGFLAVEPISNAAELLTDVTVSPSGAIFAVGIPNCCLPTPGRLWRFSPSGDRVGFGPVGSASVLSAVVALDDTTLLIAFRDPMGHRFLVCDLNGDFRAAWGSLIPGDGSEPVDIAVDPTGSVYVADPYGNRVVRYSHSGIQLSSWGHRGSGEGEFDRPSGIAVDARGSVYVAEFFNNRVQKFGPGGEFKVMWGGSASTPAGGGPALSQPMGIACLPGELVLVGSRSVDSHGNVIGAVKVFRSQDGSTPALRATWGGLKSKYR